ncbi:hypothetical protein VNO77_43706 [Canavalia gladiata]|uniref:Uncharacterized protein n=1 Tax=Canavalia gladiata TaxID=3824 RepID=A0AAN9PPN8_CANGL
MTSTKHMQFFSLRGTVPISRSNIGSIIVVIRKSHYTRKNVIHVVMLLLGCCSKLKLSFSATTLSRIPQNTNLSIFQSFFNPNRIFHFSLHPTL